MITLERARYLCSIDDNDEPTATRDTIIAITQARDALNNEPSAAARRASPVNVLHDYLMGHMRERDPATAKLLHDWSWATLESSITHLPDLRMPLHMTPGWSLEGRERSIIVQDARDGALSACRTTCGELCEAMKRWLALYRAHFQNHPAPDHAPLRRMVFLPFAVWPGEQHVVQRIINRLEPYPPFAPHVTTHHNTRLALADVASALPNASPDRPAPPLHVVSPGDAIVIRGEGLHFHQPPTRVWMTVYYEQSGTWKTRSQVEKQELVEPLVRHHPLVSVWRESMHPTGLAEYEARVMCNLWHTEESKP